MTRLNKADLRTLYTSLGRLLPPQLLPKDPSEIVAIGAVRELIAKMIVEYAPEMERGELVFSWRVPREWALTMNAYAGQKGWIKKKIRTNLDTAIRELLDGGAFPKALLHGAKTRRWVRAVRFSPRRVDEISVDVIGAKCPVDALVRAGILADDDHAHLHREARWEKTKPGSTHLLVEVFTMKVEGTHVDDEPKDEVVQQVVYKQGEFTKYLLKGLKRCPPKDVF